PHTVGRGGNYRLVAVDDHLNGLRAVWGSARGADMLEDIDAGAEGVLYRFFLVKVCMNSDVVFVCGVCDGLQFLISQTALGFDDVDGALNVVLCGFGGLGSILHNYLAVVGKDGGALNDPGAAHGHTGAGNLVFVDFVADADAFLQRGAQVYG